ncbi:MAG: translocation/assembly module TamB [Bacteroidales bacterium]|nr:translocation/assembly module TamB [Bacteroidales bacterium]
MTAGKFIKKILKRIGQILLGVFIFVWIVVAFINTTPVQSFLAAKVADYFSKEWNTEVRIGALSVTPFINAGIKDIYVEDLNKDTLLYASYVEANLGSIPSGNHVVVSNVKLDGAVCHLSSKNKQFNFQFIIDYFASSEKKEKKPSKPFILEVKKVTLNNIDFALSDYDKQDPIIDGMFATNKIVCNDINLRAKDFRMKGTDMSAVIEHLSTKERSGIALNEFKGKVKFSEKGIDLREAVLKTDDSFLDFDASLSMEGFHTYSHFVDSVYCTLSMHNGSYAGLKDACYWSERVKDATQKVYLTCDVRGTISDMTIDYFDLQTSQTHVNTDGRIYGLTDVDNTVFDLRIGDITTSIEDYNTFSLGTLVPEMNLPHILSNLGVVNINGVFNGKMSDFSSSLAVVTDLGSVDLVATAESYGESLTKYSADISSPRINVGRLLDNSILGNTMLDAHAEILGTDPENMQGSLSANMRNCYFKGNNYNDISVQGNIDGYDIRAKADIYDELVNFEGDCFVNYEGQPTISLDAAVAHLDLHKMNIMSFADTSAIVTAKIKGRVDNFDLEHLNCDISLADINVKTLTRTYNMNNINLVAFETDSVNTIRLNSDIIDADINGKYTFASITEDINYLLSSYIPDFSSVVSDSQDENNGKKIETNSNKSKSKNDVRKMAEDIRDFKYFAKSDIGFTAKVKDIDIIRSLFDLNVNVPQQIELNGKINADTLLYCNVNAPEVYYSEMKIEGTRLGIYTADDKLNLNLDIDEFALSDSMAFRDIFLQSEVDSSALDLVASLSKSGDFSTNAQIELNTVIDEKGLQGSFYNTFFTIQGTKISFNNNHVIGILNKNISVMNLILSSSNSSIVIDGKVSDNDALVCTFDNVDLSLANPFIEPMGMTVKGILNREVILKNILQSPTFTSDLEIDELAFNDVYLGKAWLNVDNNISPDVFATNIKFLHQTKGKEVVPLQLLGTISPKEERNQLDLNLSMQNFSLAIIKTFIASFASDVEGSLSCDDLKIKGKMTSPDIEGQIHCNDVALRVNMLNTKYWLNDDIAIHNNRILFNDFMLKDQQGNKITINGNITHHDFAAFDINLNAVADKIKILDTKSTSGEMYYGTAYASANVNIIGDSNMISISGSAKTEPGTSLTVPVTSKESALENDFITFVDVNQHSDSSYLSADNKEEDKSIGYSIDLDLNVNPNAKLYIPMDFTQLKGDLAAAGNGDLKIAMNSDGKFSMIGEVAIDNGTFGFNIMDVMEKKFILQQGGTLTWNGEPAGGILDVSAIYKTKASLSTLLGNEYSKPVDVESIIRLSGVMTNPQPSFDINLPNTDEQTAEQVFMYIDRSNEKTMLEQTASLLLTNQFYFSQGGYETTALQSGVTSSVMGVAFSQLSGIINNMVKIVDIDLNYTTAGSGTATSDQVNAAFSKTFGKWTAELNTSFGGTSQEATTNDGSQIIGDVSLKYKYNDNLNFEAFNHSNANDFTKYNISPYTQGARLTYKKEYEKVADIFKRKRRKEINKK